MNADQERLFAEAMARLEDMEPEARREAMLEMFTETLNVMDRSQIHWFRSEVARRFLSRPSGIETGTILTEIIDGHLGLRDLAGDQSGGSAKSSQDE